MDDVGQGLLRAACLALGCAVQDLPGRVERSLAQLRSLGVADHLWVLIPPPKQECPPPSQDNVGAIWKTSGSPDLTPECIALATRRAEAWTENLPLRLTPIADPGWDPWAGGLCSGLAFVCASQLGIIFLGWTEDVPDHAPVRRHLSPLAQFVSALGTRWSQERCREQRREDSRQRTNAALRRTSRSFRPSRRPADDEIRRNLTIFNLINDAAGDLITIHDPKGLCLYASEASMTMLGLSPDDLIGSNHFDFIHEKDQSLLRQALEAMIDHGISQCIEVRVREAGGAWRWVEARTGSVRNDEGRFCEIITVMRDISARREYEQALSFNEQNLRAILDNIGDAAWLKDATGRYLMVNPAFAQLFAREADEFVGLTESDVFDPRVAHTSLEYDQLVMLTGNQLSYTLRMPMTELEERHLEIHKGPVSDDEGTIIGITGTARDVTQRMTEHLDLARAAVLLSSVEGIAPVGVWSLCCPELGMAWSDSLYRIMGCETGAFSPTLNTVMRLVVPEDRAGLRRVIREAVGERRQFEARFRLQGDGCAIEAHTRGAGFFDAGGRLCEIAGVVYLAENQRGLGTQAQQAGQAG